MKCSDEISIGEYVRTNNHGIKRIDTIWENKTVNKYAYEIGSEWDGKLYSTIKTTDIVKHSKDIIDLAEEGDVIEINNKKYEVIFDKSYEKLGLLIPNREHLAIRHCSLEYIFSNEGMKEFESISIVPKEQIKQIEYRIKE